MSSSLHKLSVTAFELCRRAWEALNPGNTEDMRHGLELAKQLQRAILTWGSSVLHNIWYVVEWPAILVYLAKGVEAPSINNWIKARVSEQFFWTMSVSQCPQMLEFMAMNNLFNLPGREKSCSFGE